MSQLITENPLPKTPGKWELWASELTQDPEQAVAAAAFLVS